MQDKTPYGERMFKKNGDLNTRLIFLSLEGKSVNRAVYQLFDYIGDCGGLLSSLQLIFGLLSAA
jgi:hypothetical protein